MVIEVGETVVYPHHGAATITKMTTRNIKGVDTQYVKLKMHEGDLVVELPISNLEEVGVRDVIGLSDVEAVYNVLRSDTVEEPGNWSRRFKANTEKMGSGDVLRISEVVRDLWRRDHVSGVSMGEKNMLTKARQILVSELALAQKSTGEEASEVLDGVLATIVAA
jgi:CarD family transcriptional regulator